MGSTKLVYVPVKGIYKTADGLLPNRMSWMAPDAAAAFRAADAEFVSLGLPMRYSDCFRDRIMQMNAWADHQLYLKSGGKEGKAAYSPPPGFSMHESGRARDYDATVFADPAFAKTLKEKKLDQRTVVEVYRKYGIVGIVDVGDPVRVDRSEEWHFEFRGEFQQVYDDCLKRGRSRAQAYREMVRKSIEDLDPVEPKDYASLVCVS